MKAMSADNILALDAMDNKPKPDLAWPIQLSITSKISPLAVCFRCNSIKVA